MADNYAQAGLEGRTLSDHFVMDSHAHLGQVRVFLLLDSGFEGMIREMDRIGIDRSAVSSVGGTIGGWTRGNDLVLEAVRTHPDRFLGYITVNGFHDSQVLAECERCWEGGCRALKLHNAQGIPYTDKRLLPTLEFANDKGCPILLHTWGGLDYMNALLGRFPNSPWILGHSGCTEREAYARLAKEYPNAYLDTCHSVCPKGIVEYFVNQGLADKVLFGSDANFMGANQQIGRVLLADISAADKKKLLCDNARRVFKLDDS